jgi:hypothetical protein
MLGSDGGRDVLEADTGQIVSGCSNKLEAEGWRPAAGAVSPSILANRIARERWHDEGTERNSTGSKSGPEPIGSRRGAIQPAVSPV